MKTVAVILLAGFSKRFNSTKCKQVHLLNKKPIFTYSIDAFNKCKQIDELVIVVNNDVQKEVYKYLNKNKITSKVVLGGKTRQLSVENALKSLDLSKGDIVVIHDGARPLIDDKTIAKVVKAAQKYGAATTYINVVDTIAKLSKNNTTKTFINRSEIVRIQTPQAFEISLLKKAHSKAKDNLATDDCSLVALLGKEIKLVEGNQRLHKVTTVDDLTYLERLIKND